VPIVQLALEVAIGARPDAYQAEINAGRQRRGQEWRALAIAMLGNARRNVVAEADIVPRMEIRLVQADQVAASGGGNGSGGPAGSVAEGDVLMPAAGAALMSRAVICRTATTSASGGPGSGRVAGRRRGAGLSG
jgi:hypothetical protein